MTAQIKALYRYPVKGFSPEALGSVTLAKGGTFPWDRAFAIENGPSGFKASDPSYFPKTYFLMLMKNERMARYVTRFDENDGSFAISLDGDVLIRASLFTDEGRAALEDWIKAEFAEELSGEPHLLSAPDFSFSDKPEKVVHLINLESIRALEAELGQTVDPLRFRPNIVIDQVPAFEEFNWIEGRLTMPSITLNGFARTKRCAATNVDPSNGARDLQVPRTLMKRFGHPDFGIYLTVATDGSLRIGDAIKVEQRQDAALPF